MADPSKSLQYIPVVSQGAPEQHPMFVTWSELTKVMEDREGQVENQDGIFFIPAGAYVELLQIPGVNSRSMDLNVLNPDATTSKEV